MDALILHPWSGRKFGGSLQTTRIVGAKLLSAVFEEGFYGAFSRGTDECIREGIFEGCWD